MDVTMANAVVVEVGCCIGATGRLAGRVVVARIFLAVSCLGVAEAGKGAGLVAVHWVQWVGGCLTDCRVGTPVVLGVDSRAGTVVDRIDGKPAA